VAARTHHRIPGRADHFFYLSAEMVGLLQAGRYAMLLGGIALHLGGSLLMTVCGIATVQALK